MKESNEVNKVPGLPGATWKINTELTLNQTKPSTDCGCAHKHLRTKNKRRELKENTFVCGCMHIAFLYAIILYLRKLRYKRNLLVWGYSCTLSS